MTQPISQSTKPSQSDSQDSVVRLLVTMADTTWRMMTPPALLVAGGLWFDLHHATRPWATLGAAAAGLALGALLVRQQLRRVM